MKEDPESCCGRLEGVFVLRAEGDTGHENELNGGRGGDGRRAWSERCKGDPRGSHGRRCAPERLSVRRRMNTRCDGHSQRCVIPPETLLPRGHLEGSTPDTQGQTLLDPTGRGAQRVKFIEAESRVTAGAAGGGDGSRCLTGTGSPSGRWKVLERHGGDAPELDASAWFGR